MVDILEPVAMMVCVLGFCFINHKVISQLEKERANWQIERSKLLDRIQAGNFNEYKAQERADSRKIEKKEKNPIDKEPWA